MSYIDKRLQLLTIQPYRWYIISCFLAMMGNGLAYVTMAWLIVGEHNAIGSLAILMLCFWLPTVLLGPIGGVLADKFNRKLLMITSVLVRGLILLIVACILIQKPAAIVLYTLASLQGICFSIYSPSAMAAIREILPQEDLLHANVLLDMVYEIGSMIGMGVAGFLIHWLTGAGTIFLDGLLFISAAIALFMMHKNSYVVNNFTKKQTGFLSGFIQGIQYLKQNKSLCTIYIIQLMVFVAFVTAPILSAPYAKNVLHASVSQFGIIEAMLSLGVILGGFFNPYWVQIWGVKKIILAELLLLVLCLILFSVNHVIYRAQILYLCMGVCLSVWPLIVTRAQELTDLNYQGRVHSTFFSISGVLVLSVYFSAELAGDLLAIHKLYWLQAFLIMVAVILILCLGHALSGKKLKA